jgi:hypothetical protein
MQFKEKQMLQYDQSELMSKLDDTAESCEDFIKDVDELKNAPFVETLAPELTYARGVMANALKEVGTARTSIQRYLDRVSGKEDLVREMIPIPTIADTETYHQRERADAGYPTARNV